MKDTFRLFKSCLWAKLRLGCCTSISSLFTPSGQSSYATGINSIERRKQRRFCTKDSPLVQYSVPIVFVVPKYHVHSRSYYEHNAIERGVVELTLASQTWSFRARVSRQFPNVSSSRSLGSSGITAQSYQYVLAFPLFFLFFIIRSFSGGA